ncbi:MAG: cytochrome c biogenesis CcdA family protein [Vulcanimicrobiaceae bacterium]
MSPFTPQVGYPAAFAAGIVSFVSPCILPIVPAYLSFLAGISFDQLATTDQTVASRRRILAAAAAFCAGFITVFVLLGASASVVGRLLADEAGTIAKISGVLIVLLGLHYVGAFRLPWLDRDIRFHPLIKKSGPIGAYVIGLAFAFGWTPCVGPILATILVIAGNSHDLLRGVALLLAYGLGIAIPFLAAALAFGTFSKFFTVIKRHMRAVEISSGVLLIATGTLIAIGSIANVSGWLLRAFPFLANGG